MQKFAISVFGCVAVMMAVGDPAFARSHHHRHVAMHKHSHHHSWGTYASRHSRHRRGYRGFVATAQPDGSVVQPFTPEIAWQAPETAPFAPVPRPRRMRRAVVWQAPVQQQVVVAPSVAAPLGPGPFGAPSLAPRRPRLAESYRAPSGQFASLVSQHARANDLPESLVHRVIMRESRYNPRVVSRGNYGIMQIRLGTARAMGYTGSAAGLLDPNTNMTYAVRYLAGAYRAAGGNQDRAVSYYARGYYHQAKRQGFSAYARGPGI